MLNVVINLVKNGILLGDALQLIDGYSDVLSGEVDNIINAVDSYKLLQRLSAVDNARLAAASLKTKEGLRTFNKWRRGVENILRKRNKVETVFNRLNGEDTVFKKFKNGV